MASTFAVEILRSQIGQLSSLSRITWKKAVVSYDHRTLPLVQQKRLQSHESDTSSQGQIFDEKVLEHLVCPLSKKDLRYDREKNELICDELGVAYPIVNGIPNLVPQDARMLDNNPKKPSES